MPATPVSASGARSFNPQNQTHPERASLGDRLITIGLGLCVIPGVNTIVAVAGLIIWWVVREPFLLLHRSSMGPVSSLQEGCEFSDWFLFFLPISGNLMAIYMLLPEKTSSN